MDDKLVELRLLARNKRIFRALKDNGKTVPEAAAEAGLPVGRFRDIMNLHRIPTEEDIILISLYIGAPTDELFPEHLLDAVKRGVFDKTKRVRELSEDQVRTLSAAEARCLLTDGLDVERKADASMLAATVEGLLKTLDPKHRRVLELRFGLVDGRCRGLREVGAEFGVSTERIRQIEAKALRKLRHPSRSKYLKDYQG